MSESASQNSGTSTKNKVDGHYPITKQTPHTSCWLCILIKLLINQFRINYHPSIADNVVLLLIASLVLNSEKERKTVISQ